jgi:glycogen operon protein
MRSVVIDVSDYDWEDDTLPLTPMKDTIIYEMHVGGFTKLSTSNVTCPGKFQGVIEKIPYLKALGVTAVELLPVFEFDEKDVFRKLDDGRELKNYWGYSTMSYFAPEANYCVKPEEGGHLNEFRDMVKALHKAGIEVILDVVFNHTDEGNHEGPTFCFKGIDNKVYYITVPEARQYYMDYTGCGNTVNCNHPVVEKFIMDSLKFWTKEMHVDGFRFDEGSILSRDENGNPLKYAPILWNIELEEEFVNVKLIAEAWDAGGLYQIGSFPGYRWAEWNGSYRDTIRRFIRGDGGMIGSVASKIAGSADLYQHERHTPLNSINFICCHDGFTMMDLVSYNEKHNEDNGENNQDGANDNLSSNYGEEGTTADPVIYQFRQKQIKNFLSIVLLSQGVPMILSGDEVGRTQKGNNNAYCQDNVISWFDWEDTVKNKDLLHFSQEMIAFRKNNASLRRGRFFTGDKNERGLQDIEWHGCKLYSPGWDDPCSKVLSFTMGSFSEGEPDIHVMMNMSSEALSFELPAVEGRSWYCFSDTSRLPLQNIATKELVELENYLVTAFSIVILISA